METKRSKINNQFKSMISLVGEVNSVIVVGPPGIGKTHGITEKIESLGQHATFVKGTSSAIVLYQRLWQTRGPNFTLVIDDCDSLLTDRAALNVLKSALDTYDVRTVQWNTQNNILRANDIPQEFQYEGKVVFITNTDLTAPPAKWKPHWEAFVSRSYYIDLDIKTIEDKLERCRMVVEGGMFTGKMKTDDVRCVFGYLETFAPYFREVSLRTVLQLSELKEKFPDTWEQKATLAMVDPPSRAAERFKGTADLNFNRDNDVIDLEAV